MIRFCFEPSKHKTFALPPVGYRFAHVSGVSSLAELLQIPDLQQGRLYDSHCRTAQNLESCYGKVDLVVQPVVDLNPDWEHRPSIPHQLPGVVDELCHKTPSCRNHRTSMIEGRVSQCQNSVITILQHRHFDESLDLSTCLPSAIRSSVMLGRVASRYTGVSE